MPRVTIRFYEELNGFLPVPLRGKEVEVELPPTCTVKAAVENLGVPHTEVDLVLADGTGSVGFDHRPRDGERLAVFPVFEAWDVGTVSRVRPAPLRLIRFAADVHLVTLAGYLRMFGFDTVVSGDRDDEQLALLARRDSRIILTRDRRLLMRRIVTHGIAVRALAPREQLAQVFARLDLAGPVRRADSGSGGLFSRCMACNGVLERVQKAQVAEGLPPRVASDYDCFSRCPGCARVFWRGTHWEGMLSLAREMLGSPLNGIVG
jgi:uncharacterized protein